MSFTPGIISVKGIAAVKAEVLGHGEIKSADMSGEPAGADSRGLLKRRHVSPSELRLIGKEANALELVEAGLFGDWSSILATYGGEAPVAGNAWLCLSRNARPSM